MAHVKILDVTLRDGGYRNNFNFTEDQAQIVVAGLASAGVDLCEIGYCKGSFAPKGEHGLTSDVGAGFIEKIAQAANGRIELAVMVHPRNITTDDFAMLREQGVSMIRVCLRRDQLNEGLVTLSLARDHGFSVSANVTHVTSQTPGSVLDTAVRAEGAGADIVCCADSNGHMLPADVDRLFSRLSSRLLVPLGFHAHNNMSLALANAVAAIEAGAEYIDTSICGMGKGAGNLHLSMLVAYLERTGVSHGYDLVKVMELSEATARAVPHNNMPSPLMDIILGTYNFPYDSSQRVRDTLERFQLTSEYRAIEVMHQQDKVARLAPRAVLPTIATGLPNSVKGVAL
ncbi:HMG-CoA lyase-like protein [Pseudomonas syringae pv. aceris]|jgi:4-hydroxy 2-oxovalerate aldolase|uniref:aldolase catalytic domain-containing protein n=1 Tax=Pseudomonas syringae TaxID=317 RepID=UPI000EFE0742|nr:aldolase catalytic domain-containing protein [Pseudomonas syringae]MCK9750156.1 aldolase catalytic domain-containing protein [Pseudomonas syringae pv. syringae]MDU8603050.1 aldolase catalytic domain-containing protein [Pseudomonas syringae]RMS56666.1 HMG-CoA lyase-like protein [Pseudomonas syringae pv. aceris]RMS64600.1 HMG-CoA lyase-like protein [Pseudomonas syringae pv. aceris]